MKHFTIHLVDGGRQTRQWSVWATTLTVGSDPRSKLVLPAPAAAHVGAYRSDASIELPFGHLVVHEDTPTKNGMWELAKARISRARVLGWHEPGEKGRNVRAAVYAAMGVLAFFLMGAMFLIGAHPPRAEQGELPATIIDLVPMDQVKVDPPKPVEIEPVVIPEAGADQPIDDPNLGGSMETRTVVQRETTPASVMDNSVMGRISATFDGLQGEQVDPNQANMIDVILAGGGGTLTRGDRGGHTGGDGDRMAAVGGIGLGVGGRNGFGTGRGSIAGRMRPGANGTGTSVAMRATIPLPKPTDVELGGEAGSRSPESILRVIRTHIGGFRYSYEKALKDNPEIGGKISLKFTIAPSGDITAIEVVSSSTGFASLDDDIKDKARRMKFDSIERGNVTVTYAFVLDRQ